MRGWLFPGQGSQYRGDGRSVGRPSRREIDPGGGVRRDGSRRRGRLPRRRRPRHHGVRAARAARLRRRGVPRPRGRRASPPSGVAGHSLGEFAALVAAGVVSLADALDLVVVRGAAMQRAGEERPGAMTALLGVGAEDAASLCDEVRGDDVLVVANENSPAQVVISGSVAAIERAEALAKERKVRAVRLPVAGAFHSPLMEPARARDRRAHRRDRVLRAPVPGRGERGGRPRVRPGRAPRRS